jgi:hypothetical protein
MSNHFLYAAISGLLLYITPCLSSGRSAEYSPLSVTCYHLNSYTCLVYEHMSPFCIVVTVDIIMKAGGDTRGRCLRIVF